MMSLKINLGKNSPILMHMVGSWYLVILGCIGVIDQEKGKLIIHYKIQDLLYLKYGIEEEHLKKVFYDHKYSSHYSG